MNDHTTASGQPGAASALLRWQLRLAHHLLEETIAGLPTEAILRQAPGATSSIGARYAQTVLGEDLTVNGMLAGGQPLALSTWAGQTGLGELPPLGRPLAELSDWSAWSRRVRIDLAQLQRYARAVFAATDAYLATVADETLAPASRALPGCLLTGLLLTIAARRGEIVALAASAFRPAATAARPGCSARFAGRPLHPTPG